MVYILAALGFLVLLTLILNFNGIVDYLYRHRYFADAFDLATTDSGYQPRVLNFDFSLRDMEYFDTFAAQTSFEAGKRQTVALNIGNMNYTVDLMPFQSYFRRLGINKEKNAFCVHFPPGNPLGGNVRQFDLFRTREADFFEQELIYSLGKQLGLYIPKTDFVNIYINYVDYGDYVLKQSFDEVFLEENNIPDSVIFMVETGAEGDITSRYLYRKDTDKLIEAHLKRFPQLLRQRDPNLLLKYFDLDYIARFDALRRLLNAGGDFILQDNLRYIYNKVNGKLYPVLDESNIVNIPEDQPSEQVRFLQKQIRRHPLIKRKRKQYLRQLAASFDEIKKNHRNLFRKYRQLTGNLYYQLRIRLVDQYFKRHVYHRLKKEGAKKIKKKDGGGEPTVLSLLERSGQTVPVSSTNAYLDQMLLPPHLFVKNHPGLDITYNQEEGVLSLEPGDYTIDKTVIVPTGVRFRIKAGVTLRLAPDESLVSYSPLEIEGTPGNPVTIAALDPQRPFGAVAVMGSGASSTDGCVVKNLNFSGGSRAFIHGVKHTGGLNINNIDAHIENSTIHHNTENKGLVIKKSTVFISETRFHSNYNDQLTLEFCRGIVRDNRFYDTGGALSGDGVSLKSSQILFRDNRFENLADKGVSIAKGGLAILYNNVFQGNRTGVSCRAGGQALVLANRFNANQTAVNAYQRQFPRGGGNIYLLNNTFRDNRYFYKIDAYSKCYLLDGRGLLADSLYRNLNRKDVDELFNVFHRIRNTYIYKSNPFREFVVGNTPAYIDASAKVVLVDLPNGSPANLPVTFKCRLENTDVLIEPLAFGAREPGPDERKQSQLKNKQNYNFRHYIFRGRLNLVHDYQVDTYELVVTSGGLPIVEINTADSSGYPVDIVNEPKIPCKIRFLHTVSESAAQVPLEDRYINRILNARIEGRGQKWDKWKYGFTLGKSLPLEGMTKSKRWVLESCYVEKSLMRPKIAFDLYDSFRQPGWKRIAPQGRHVEVILNGNYIGVYLLVEHIDRDFLALQDFDKNESYNSLLYRAKNKNANFSRYNNPDALYRKGYEDIIGGIQPLDKERDPIRGWSSGYEQRHPNPDKYGEYWSLLKDFSTFVAYAPDDEFERRIVQFLDIDRFINMWIFIQLVDDSDGLYQNRYLVREKGKDSLWYFVPWDKDGILGRDFKMQKRSWAIWLKSNLFSRCMKIHWFREAFKNTWDSLLADGVISEERLVKMIDENARLLTDAQKRNFQRWPTHPDNSPYPDDYGFEEEILFMKDWIKHRIQYLYNRVLRIHNPENY